MKKVLERDTSKIWMERYKGKVRVGRLPPKWLAKLGKTVFETVTIRRLIVYRWNLNIAKRVGRKIKITSNQLYPAARAV